MMKRMRIPTVAAEGMCTLDDYLTKEEEHILAELHSVQEIIQWIKGKLPFLEDNSGGEHVRQVLMREMDRLRQSANNWRARLGDASYRKHVALGHTP